MAHQLTFIHAADLHIGAPFRGLRSLSDRWAQRLLEAIPQAYDRVIGEALKLKVDFVVIAGDIFDTTRASYTDYIHFFHGLQKLGEAGIPVYLCTGNHDPYTSWQQDFFTLHSSAYMFSAKQPDFVLYERAGEPLCLLGGRGYYNQTWSFEENIAEGITRAAAEEVLGERAATAPFSVAVLHTGLDLDPVKAPTNPTELLQSGFDYWALGHIHKRYAFPPDNPKLVFSGCIQGRDIKETGERGVNLVTLEEGLPNKIEFIPTASVVWQRMDVNIEACKNISEVDDKIMRELFRVNGQAHCEEMCVRITLVGSTSLHAALNRPGVLEDLRQQINNECPDFFCDALIDSTRKPLDKKVLRNENLFPAVFLNVAESLKGSPEEESVYIQDEFLKKAISLPHGYAANMEALSEEAENLVLDLLGSDEN